MPYQDLGYQTQCAYYPEAPTVKLFEHELLNGQLINTKIFSETGTILHELILIDGFVTTFQNFNTNSQLMLKLDSYCKKANTFQGNEYNLKGDINFCGSYKDGNRNGPGTEFNDNGVNICDGIFKDGELNGLGTLLYPNGKKIYEGNFKAGQKEGRGKDFHENGVLKYDGLFRSGEYYDFGRVYNDSGVLESEGIFGKGGESFEGVKFHPDGTTKKCEGLFIENKLIRKGDCWYETGAIKYSGEWRKSKYDGYGAQYHSNGGVKYLGYFKDGKYDGSGEVFDYCGKVMCRAEWVDGEIENFKLANEQLQLQYKILPWNDNEVYIGDAEKNNESLSGYKESGYGYKFNNKTGLKRFEGNFSDGDASGFGKQYFKGDMAHPIQEYIGNFRGGAGAGHGQLFFNNGKIFYRGIYEASKPNKKKFYIYYKRNGMIDIEGSAFLKKVKSGGK